MAKFKPINGDLRGSIAGVTFSRNTYGAYARQKVTPVNPNTPYQQLIRQRHATLAGYYEATLDEGERLQWQQYAANNPIQDVFGDPIVLSGIAMFERVNHIVLANGDEILPTPPGDATEPGILGTVALIYDLKAPGSCSFSFVDEAPPGSYSIFLYAAYPVNPGKKYVDNLFKFMSAFTGDPASPIDCKDEFVARFGVPVEGQIGWVRAKVLNTESYKLSAGSDARFIVVDTT